MCEPPLGWGALLSPRGRERCHSNRKPSSVWVQVHMQVMLEGEGEWESRRHTRALGKGVRDFSQSLAAVCHLPGISIWQ